MDIFYEKLNEECGVRLPYPNEQDWELCAGDYKRTDEYIRFYKKYTDELSNDAKYLLSHMIVQGIEDLLLVTTNEEYINMLWLETRSFLINDELYDVIVYWSCIGQQLEDSWNITARMRELLKELI